MVINKVFVYGSLKSGFGNHSVISNQKFVNNSITTDSSWEMFSMGSFPGVVRGERKLSGEVYEVDSNGMKRLDMLEGNGNFYTREIINTSEGEAWMYILPDGESEGYLNGYPGEHRVYVINGVMKWV